MVSDFLGGNKAHLKGQSTMLSVLEKIEQLSETQHQAAEDRYADFTKRWDSVISGRIVLNLETQTNLLNDISANIRLIAGTNNKSLKFESSFDKYRKQTFSLPEEAAKVAIMAGAVLALGTAFGVVGNIDLKSVIGTSLAIFIIAEGFARMSQVKGLNLINVGLAGILLPALVMSIVTASYAMKLIAPVSPKELMNAIGIAVALYPMVLVFSKIFGVLALGVMDRILLTLVSMKFNVAGQFDITKTALAIIPGLAIAMAAASWALSLAKVVPGKLLLSLIGMGIALIPLTISFVTIFGAVRLLGKVPMVSIAITSAAIIMMSIGMVGASYVLSSLNTGFTAKMASSLFLMGLAFIPMAIVYKTLSTMSINPVGIIIAASILPIMSAGIAGALWLFSKVPANAFDVPVGIADSILRLSIAFIPLAITFMFLGGVVRSTKRLITAAVALPILAGSIVAIAYVFKMMPDDLSDPDLGWTFRAFTTLAIAGIALRIMGVRRWRLKSIIFANIALPLLAASIVAVGHIFLRLPPSFLAPDLKWTLKTFTALTAIGLFIPLLGIVPLSTIAKGMLAALVISMTITVMARDVFVGLPTKMIAPDFKWSLQIGTALLAIMPTIIIFSMLNTMMLLKAGISLIFISTALVAMAHIFNTLPEASKMKSPPLAWSVGIGLSLLTLGGMMALLGVIPLPVIAMGALNVLIIGGILVGLTYLLSLVNPKAFMKDGLIYTIVDTMIYLVKGLAGVFVYAAKELLPIIGEVITNIVAILSKGNAIQAIQQFVLGFTSELRGFVRDITPIIQIVGGVVNTLLVNVKDLFVSFLPIIKDAVQGVLGIIMEGMKGMFNLIKTTMTYEPSRIMQTGLALITLAGGFAALAAALAGASLGSLISNVVDGITDFVMGESKGPDVIGTLETILTKTSQIEVAGEKLNAIAVTLSSLASLGNANFEGLDDFFTLIHKMFRSEDNSLTIMANSLMIANRHLEKLHSSGDKFTQLTETISSLATQMNLLNESSVSVVKVFTSMNELTSEQLTHMMQYESILTKISTGTNRFADTASNRHKDLLTFSNDLDHINDQLERMVMLEDPLERIANRFERMATSMGQFSQSINEINPELLKDTNDLFYNVNIAAVPESESNALESVSNALNNLGDRLSNQLNQASQTSSSTPTVGNKITKDQTLERIVQLNEMTLQIMSELTNKLDQINSTLSSTLTVKEERF